MMKEAARVEAKRVVVAEERGWRCGGMSLADLRAVLAPGGFDTVGGRGRGRCYWRCIAEQGCWFAARSVHRRVVLSLLERTIDFSNVPPGGWGGEAVDAASTIGFCSKRGSNRSFTRAPQ